MCQILSASELKEDGTGRSLLLLLCGGPGQDFTRQQRDDICHLGLIGGEAGRLEAEY